MLYRATMKFKDNLQDRKTIFIEKDNMPAALDELSNYLDDTYHGDDNPVSEITFGISHHTLIGNG